MKLKTCLKIFLVTMILMGDLILGVYGAFITGKAVGALFVGDLRAMLFLIFVFPVIVTIFFALLGLVSWLILDF